AICVLDLVRARRQAVLQEPLEHQLAESPTRLRRAQQVLERGDVLRELADALTLLAEGPELPGQIRERALRRAGLCDELLFGRAKGPLELGAKLAHRHPVRDAQLVDARAEDVDRRRGGGWRSRSARDDQQRRARDRHAAERDNDARFHSGPPDPMFHVERPFYLIWSRLSATIIERI